MRVLSVVGARPQFIKAAPLSTWLRRTHHEFLVHTGQHYDDEMSGIFFEELGIPQPDVNLNVGAGSHAEHLAGMIVPLEKIMVEERPDVVLVYGDTNSTLAGALTAAKLNYPIAHVEAGLRSYNRTMPEEINRVLTDQLSTLLFCPTQAAVNNLEKEGITSGVYITGDIMADAVVYNLERARLTSTIHSRLELDTPYMLATIHRPANADDAATLREIVAALSQLDCPVMFPVHPRTRKKLNEYQIQLGDQIRLSDPLGYLDMLAIVDRASVVITDSGGLQKEAYLLKTPCITIRTETEWIETVQSGWNCLVEPVGEAIITAYRRMREYQPAEHPDFYGDGHCAEEIVRLLENHFI